MVRRARIAAPLLVVCLLGQIFLPGGAAQAIAPDDILVEGRGWGHGRGLQQWAPLVTQ